MDESCDCVLFWFFFLDLLFLPVASPRGHQFDQLSAVSCSKLLLYIIKNPLPAHVCVVCSPAACRTWPFCSCCLSLPAPRTSRGEEINHAHLSCLPISREQTGRNCAWQRWKGHFPLMKLFIFMTKSGPSAALSASEAATAYTCRWRRHESWIWSNTLSKQPTHVMKLCHPTARVNGFVLTRRWKTAHGWFWFRSWAVPPLANSHLPALCGPLTHKLNTWQTCPGLVPPDPSLLQSLLVLFYSLKVSHHVWKPTERDTPGGHGLTRLFAVNHMSFNAFAVEPRWLID